MDGFSAIGLQLLQEAKRDERVIEGWLLNGMVGQLVRFGPQAPLEVVPCDASHNGEWVIWVREAPPNPPRDMPAEGPSA